MSCLHVGANVHTCMCINHRHFSAHMSTHAPTCVHTGVPAHPPIRITHMPGMRRLPHAPCICTLPTPITHTHVHHLCAHVHCARVRARAKRRGGSRLVRAKGQGLGALVVACLLLWEAAASCGRAVGACTDLHTPRTRLSDVGGHRSLQRYMLRPWCGHN